MFRASLFTKDFVITHTVLKKKFKNNQKRNAILQYQDSLYNKNPQERWEAKLEKFKKKIIEIHTVNPGGEGLLQEEFLPQGL